MENHTVTLTDKEQQNQVAIVTKIRNKVAYIQHAHILLKSAAGKTDLVIGRWRTSAIHYAMPRCGFVKRIWKLRSKTIPITLW